MNLHEYIKANQIQPLPEELREAFREDAKSVEFGLDNIAAITSNLRESAQTHSAGNVHPGFMGWVQGGGTAAGMIGIMNQYPKSSFYDSFNKENWLLLP